MSLPIDTSTAPAYEPGIYDTTLQSVPLPQPVCIETDMACIETDMENPNAIWNTPKYRLLFGMVTEGVTSIVVNSVELIATTFDAVTAGQISPLRTFVNQSNRPQDYKLEPLETNPFAVEFLIFIKILNKSSKFCFYKVNFYDVIKPFTFENHSSVDKTRKMLTDKGFARRHFLTRIRFAGIGLSTLIKQVICIVVAPFFTLAALVTLGRFKNLNRNAYIALASTNVIHTVLNTLRLVINPHACKDKESPIVFDGRTVDPEVDPSTLI